MLNRISDWSRNSCAREGSAGLIGHTQEQQAGGTGTTCTPNTLHLASTTAQSIHVRIGGGSQGSGTGSPLACHRERRRLSQQQQRLRSRRADSGCNKCACQSTCRPAAGGPPPGGDSGDVLCPLAALLVSGGQAAAVRAGVRCASIHAEAAAAARATGPRVPSAAQAPEERVGRNIKRG